MKHILFSVFCSFIIVGGFISCSNTPNNLPDLPQKSAENHPGFSDTAAFYAQLCMALQKRDPNLLLPLLADHLRCDFTNGDNECDSRSGCSKQVVLERYFKDANAEGWTKFDLLQRVRGFGERSECINGGERRTFLMAPYFPDTITDPHQSYEYAYVFANQVQIRATPSKNGKVLRQVSHSFLLVDTEELCYGDTDDDWLPVILNTDETAYVFMDFTSWSDRQGYIQVMRDAKGILRIVDMTWGRHPLGTWRLLGCC
jgi:hypothetical protein